MRFRYHMYGEEIGKLRVFRNGDGVMRQLLWQQDGNQGNKWHEAEFLIDCNVTAYQVISFSFSVFPLFILLLISLSSIHPGPKHVIRDILSRP